MPFSSFSGAIGTRPLVLLLVFCVATPHPSTDPLYIPVGLWMDTYPVNFLPSNARRPSANSFSFNFSLPHS